MNTCRLAFFPSARNKQLDILDSHYVFKVRSQSCLESSSTVHQDSIFMTSFFFSKSPTPLLLLVSISFKTENFMHQKSFPWKWRSVVESPKEAWCQSERPGRLLLTNRRNMAFRFMPFVVELLRLPFSCYNFQLFVGDSSFYYYFEEDVCDL